MARRPGQSKPELGIYDRNRRLAISKGTREASVVSIVLATTLKARAEAERRGRQAVIEAFEKEWGTPPPSLCTITHTHLTVQLVTTLRVEPS